MKEDPERLRTGIFLASLPFLKKIWDNPRDAEYEKL